MEAMRALVVACSFLQTLSLQIPSAHSDDTAFAVQLPGGTWASPEELISEQISTASNGGRSKRLTDLLQVDAPEGGVADLPYMYGRLGDSLWQLTNALLFAELNHCKSVTVGLRGRHKIAGFLQRNLQEIPVSPYPGNVVTSSCTHGQPGNIYFVCDASPEDRRRIFLQYIKPLVAPAAKVDAHKGGDVDELVIHIRSGDVFKDAKGCFFLKKSLMECKMPPCAYYDYIIEQGNGGKPFNQVRVVTETDRMNPCINQIKLRHPQLNVTIQSKTREEDAAAIMSAKHLAVSQTLFAWEMAQLNDKLQTLFYMDTAALHQYHPGGLMPCKQPWNPTVIALNVDGVEEDRMEPSERGAWMVNYPRDGLSVKSLCGPGKPQFLAAFPVKELP